MTEMNGNSTNIMKNSDDIFAYLLGGHGSFTVESMTTGDHLTFCTRWSGDQSTLFLHLLVSPDTYRYLGLLIPGDTGVTLRLTRKSCAGEDAKSVEVVRWLLRNLLKDELPDVVAFMHDGRCCRCGRQLTTPESIGKGIGPVCEGRLEAA